ncbi:MAG: hypothetical protein N3E39_00050 [Candidatus Methanomethylicia archaeon]|nr:hypothetical protein [Candidatus Methanomethylicia archaeon]
MFKKHFNILILSLIFFSVNFLLIPFSYAGEEVWVDYNTVVVKPGDTATFTISLKGNGTYSLSVEYLPKDWIVKFYEILLWNCRSFFN